MTREEQLQRESEIYAWTANQFDIQLAFEKGAEWADKTMVDKACKWLKENLSRYASRDNPNDFPYGFPTRDFRLDLNFERDFRKAMEE